MNDNFVHAMLMPTQFSQPERPSVSTDVKPVRYTVESATPRAQNMQDMLDDGSRLRSSSTSSLESQFTR